MIKELINQWEDNKKKLATFFRKTKQEDFASYGEIITAMLRICMPVAPGGGRWQLDKISRKYKGGDHGTIVFVIPTNMGAKYTTHAYYGTCSACDVLQAIQDCTSGRPTREQVKGYMTLALHLLQRLKAC